LEEHPSQKAIVNWFKKEGKGLKHGWVLFFVIALGLIYASGRSVHWIDKQLNNAAMNETNTVQSATNHEYETKIDTLKTAIT
jgi:hypothetical protein